MIVNETTSEMETSPLEQGQSPIKKKKMKEIRHLKVEKIEAKGNNSAFRIMTIITTVTLAIIFLYFKLILLNLLENNHENVCNNTFDVKGVIDKLESRVYGQENVMEDLRQAFQEHSSLSTLALVGSVGVGKTLVAETISSNFLPWNVNYYFWDDFSKSDLNNYNEITEIITSYPKSCQQKLFIIDNLKFKDRFFVEDINRMLKNYEFKNVQLFVIFIFSLETYSEEGESLYEEHKSELQKLDRIKVIQFRRFDETDLDKFLIKFTNKSEEDRLQLVKGANVKAFGLKRVSMRIF